MSGGNVTITYKLDEGEFAAITKKLQDIAGNKARVYIARALNKTATTARVKLAAKAQASYTVKTGGFKKDMQIKKASAGDLTAIIRSHGDTLDIKKFKYSAPKSGVKVDIVRSGLKPLGKYGNKAFVGRGSANGHVYVRQTKDRLPIEKLKSKSTPYMIGSRNRVYGVLEPQIKSDLKKYMGQQIKALIG